MDPSSINLLVSQLDEAHSRLLCCHPLLKSALILEQRADLDYFKNKIYDQVLENIDQIDFYFQTQIERLVLANPVVNQGDTTIVRTHDHIKLPDIQLPVFVGDFTKWVEFSELFQALIIDNDRLTRIKKLNSLKSSLKGEASSLIRNISVSSADNFEVDWRTLLNRYQNHHLIVAQWLNSVLDLPIARGDDVNSVNNLLDTVILTVEALLPHKVDIRSVFLVCSILRNFDKSLRSSWEEKHSCDKEYTTFA